MAFPIRLRILNRRGQDQVWESNWEGWSVGTASTTYANFDISVQVWVEF